MLSVLPSEPLTGYSAPGTGPDRPVTACDRAGPDAAAAAPGYPGPGPLIFAPLGRPGPKTPRSAGWMFTVKAWSVTVAAPALAAVSSCRSAQSRARPGRGSSLLAAEQMTMTLNLRAAPRPGWARGHRQ
jgi:hypothetical protein